MFSYHSVVCPGGNSLMLLPYQFGYRNFNYNSDAEFYLQSYFYFSYMPIAFSIRRVWHVRKEIFHASIGGKGNATLMKLN